MPQFIYRGRNKEGHLRVGRRDAASADMLNNTLIKEGIFPIEISLQKAARFDFEAFQDWFQNKSLQLEELSIFSRQMQLLSKANVPMITALKQLAEYTRSRRLSKAIKSVIDDLEKGNTLSTAFQNCPGVFTPLMVHLVQIGENTGNLSSAFLQIHDYLEFELTNTKQIKAAFRYPSFVLFTIILSILSLNLFVIPTFARFYSKSGVTLPWQTRLLISSSNFFIHDGLYALIGLIILIIWLYRYVHTPTGRYQYDAFKFKLPMIGKILKRLALIRFSQTFAITIEAGLSVTKSLDLINNLLQNAYLKAQILEVKESIERGKTFTESIKQLTFLTPLEMQILSVGDQNGALGPALSYIAFFHAHEMEYDLKRMQDTIGPVLIGIVSILILIMALGIYLPIWNMVNLYHA